MGLWTAGFVMLTLLINGPLISPLIRWLGLSKVSAAKKQVWHAGWKGVTDRATSLREQQL